MASTASFMVMSPAMSSGPSNSTDAIETSLAFTRSLAPSVERRFPLQ